MHVCIFCRYAVDLGYATPFVAFLFALILFGIDEVGVEIEGYV
jgi:predicted membrane chloride channel (bestrophin family)